MELCPNTIRDGDIDDAVLDRKINVAFGAKRLSKEWKNRPGTVEGLLLRLEQWRRGDKDGQAITQCELGAGGGQRMTQFVSGCDLIMVDIDTGCSLDVIAQKIKDAGLFAVMWTTYSHLRPSTDVAESAFLSWCKKSKITPAFEDIDLGIQLIEYLCTEKRMEESLFEDGCTIVRGMTDKGVSFTVNHAPCPRSRALFVLNETFSFLKGGSKKERDNEWKRLYAGFSTALGLPYDQSCVDPARLMYLPALAVGADISKHEFRVIAGSMVDLYAYAYIDEKDANAHTDGEENEFTKAAKDVPGLSKTGGSVNHTHGDRFKPVTPALLEFVAKYPDFDPIAWLTENYPDDLRGQNNSDTKIEFCCPYEDGHSSADPEQVPFFVSTENGGWYMGCQTDGCKGNSGGDRLYFLDGLMQKYQYPPLMLQSYSPTKIAERDAVAAKNEMIATTQLNEAVEKFASITPSSGPEDILAGLNYIKELPTTYARNAAIRELANACGKSEAVLTKDLKAIIADAEKESLVDRHPLPKDYTKCSTIWDEWDFNTRVEIVKARLAHVNKKNPQLFMPPEGGSAIRIRVQSDKVCAEDMNERHWDYAFSQMLQFREIIEGEDKGVQCPPGLRGCISACHDLELPLLKLVTRTAIFAPDGTLPVEKGYHHASCTYFDPNYDPIPLAEAVSEDDVDVAVAWIMEAIRDFPFSDAFDGMDPLPVKMDERDAEGFREPNWARGESSRANCIAMLLQPFARNLIKGPCPAYHIDKASPGTGAGYLANVLYLIMTGDIAAGQTMSPEPEELSKAITATLREGAPLIFFDNINHHVDSPDLAAALTTGKWKARILGQSNMVTIPVSSTWVLAGNSVTFSHELIRRLVPIRMDAATPNPAKDRGVDDFKHYPLQQWIEDNRPQLVWSLQVLVRNWLQKGRKNGRRIVNSFDGWSAVMGGIIEAAGVPGFLANLDDYQGQQEGEARAADRLVHAMAIAFGDQEFTVAELYEKLKDPFTDKLPADLPIAGRDESGQVRSLGHLIKKEVQGNVFDLLPDNLSGMGKVDWKQTLGLRGGYHYRVSLTKRRVTKGMYYSLKTA